MTQIKLSSLVYCSADMIRKIEADERRPGPELVALLAEHLGVNEHERRTFFRFARGESSIAPSSRQTQAPEAQTPLHAPTNLLVQATSLIGRDQEVARIQNRVRNRRQRLLTLTGPGGVGKTRLALAVAEKLMDAFPDGIYVVDLATTTDPARVVTSIAQVVGVRENAAQPTEDALKAFLRDQRVLLVLDNFEHVLKAAPRISELLAVAPDLVVITTSREALDLHDEYELVVQPLALPQLERHSSAASLAENAAVALFVERAKHVAPSFALTEENARTIAEICNQLDGLPLAIELAAARMKLLSPAILLDLLRRPFELLVGGPRDAPARQKNLRATLNWSYELLDSWEQELFRRLAVFPGGCTWEAAAVVCCAHPARSGDAGVEIPSVLDSLGSLQDKSLLNRVGEPDGEPRYRMLTTIREYALDRLSASGEADSVRQRHARFFLLVAKKADRAFQGRDQRVWLQSLEVEHDNLRAALTWCLVNENRAVTGLRLVAVLWQFWDAHGHLQEGRRWLEMALERGTTAPAPLRAKVLHGLGSICGVPTKVAHDLLEESLALRRLHGNKRDIAQSLCRFGANKGFQGDYGAGRQLLEESLTLFRAVGDPLGEAAALDNLGHIARREGDYERAKTFQTASLKIREQVDDTRGVAWSYNNLGWLDYDQGAYTEAAAWFDKSLRLWIILDDKRSIAAENSNLARVALARGDYEQAFNLLGTALQGFYDLNDLGAVAYMLEGYAGLAALGWQTELGAVRAAQLFGAAEALRETAGAPLPPADRPDYEAHISMARQHVDENTWCVKWKSGREMPLNKVITFANSQKQDEASG